MYVYEIFLQWYKALNKPRETSKVKTGIEKCKDQAENRF
jgi:hypothetical protein